MADTPILRARGLGRELGGEVKQKIVQDIDLDVRAGEFVSLTGPSGSGKSTLLYLLGLLDNPTSGKLFINGTDTSQLDDDARSRFRSETLGYVFQFHFLLPEFDVLENVTLPLLRRGISARDAKDRGVQALESLGLGDKIDRKVHQLSGGQQQRVAIARAIAGRPTILLADEPTGALDSTSGETVMGIFNWLTEKMGMTLVMVTHDRAFASRASREVSLKDGRIVDAVYRSQRDGYRTRGDRLPESQVEPVQTESDYLETRVYERPSSVVPPAAPKPRRTVPPAPPPRAAGSGSTGSGDRVKSRTSK